MAAKIKQFCWEIMQCDENNNCPVKENKIDCCWEWMEEHKEFQSQCGLCHECIVYHCNSEDTFPSESERSQFGRFRLK